MNRPALACFGLILILLAMIGCEAEAPRKADPLAALTLYQRTAIEMCNQAEKRLQAYHRFARQAGSRKIYVGLSAPVLAETIQTYTGDHRGSTFREFINQFANEEAAFVWRHRMDSPTSLQRAHLEWCREQGDWISSYR